MSSSTKDLVVVPTNDAGGEDLITRTSNSTTNSEISGSGIHESRIPLNPSSPSRGNTNIDSRSYTMNAVLVEQPDLPGPRLVGEEEGDENRLRYHRQPHPDHHPLQTQIQPHLYPNRFPGKPTTSTSTTSSSSPPSTTSSTVKPKSKGMKRLPSLHEIGLVYVNANNNNNKTTELGLVKSTLGSGEGGKANLTPINANVDPQIKINPKPLLHRLITTSTSTSTSTILNPNQTPKQLINSLSPYTSSPFPTSPSDHPGPTCIRAGSPASTTTPSRLRLPLSALNRVVDGLGLGGGGLVGGLKEMDGMKEVRARPEGEDQVESTREMEEQVGIKRERQTIQIPLHPTKADVLDLPPNFNNDTNTIHPETNGMLSSITPSTWLTMPTPMLITPAEEGLEEAIRDRGGVGLLEGKSIVRGLGSLSPGLNAIGPDGRGGKVEGGGLGDIGPRKSRWGEALTSEQDGPVSSDAKDGHTKTIDKALPLQHKWTLYYDTGKPLSEQDKVNSFSGTTLAMIPESQTPHKGTKNHIEKEFEARLLILGEFDTVQGFGKTFGQTFDMKRNHPSKMGSGHNLHLFKDGIRPMYEDPANAQGGRWTLILPNLPGMLDRVWQNLVCALIGETVDPEDEICGAVISIRPKVERLQVWLRNKDEWDKVEQIGHGLLRELDIAGPNVVMSLEFAGNTGQLASPRPHLAIGKGAKHGNKLAQPRVGPPGLPLSRTPSFAGSVPTSRRSSPTQSGFLNPFAGPLGIAQQSISPRPSSLRPGRS